MHLSSVLQQFQRKQLPASLVGLQEIASVRATLDSREVGVLNPNVRALIAYNTDSDVLPTVRTNGVLLAQATPRGGLLSGQSSVVQLDAWNWQDAVVRADDGQHLTWPEMVFRLNPNEEAAALDKRQKAREQGHRNHYPQEWQCVGKAFVHPWPPPNMKRNANIQHGA